VGSNTCIIRVVSYFILHFSLHAPRPPHRLSRGLSAGGARQPVAAHLPAYQPPHVVRPGLRGPERCPVFPPNAHHTDAVRGGEVLVPPPVQPPLADTGVVRPIDLHVQPQRRRPRVQLEPVAIRVELPFGAVT
jgi:hypothetical protein